MLELLIEGTVLVLSVLTLASPILGLAWMLASWLMDRQEKRPLRLVLTKEELESPRPSGR